MNVNVTGAYIYFTIPVFGGIHITQTTVSVFLVTVLLMIAGYLLGRNLQKRPGKLQVLTEKGVEETGTHLELMAKGGIYSHMYSMYTTDR